MSACREQSSKRPRDREAESLESSVEGTDEKRSKSTSDQHLIGSSKVYIYYPQQNYRLSDLNLEIHTKYDEKLQFQIHVFKNVSSCEFAKCLKHGNYKLLENSRLVEINGVKVSHYQHDLVLETFARQEDYMSMTVIVPDGSNKITMTIKFRICIQDDKIIAERVQIVIQQEGDKTDIYCDVEQEAQTHCYIATTGSTEDGGIDCLCLKDTGSWFVDGLPLPTARSNFELCVQYYSGIDETDQDPLHPRDKIVVIGSLRPTNDGLYQYLAATSESKVSVVTLGIPVVGRTITDTKIDNRFFIMHGIAGRVYFESLAHRGCYLMWNQKSHQVELMKIEMSKSDVRKHLEKKVPEAIFEHPENHKI